MTHGFRVRGFSLRRAADLAFGAAAGLLGVVLFGAALLQLARPAFAPASFTPTVAARDVAAPVVAVPVGVVPVAVVSGGAVPGVVRQPGTRALSRTAPRDPPPVTAFAQRLASVRADGLAHARSRVNAPSPAASRAVSSVGILPPPPQRRASAQPAFASVPPHASALPRNASAPPRVVSAPPRVVSASPHLASVSPRVASAPPHSRQPRGKHGRALLPPPEPPLGYDPHPALIAVPAEAQAPASLDGIPLRGRISQTPSAP